MRKPIPSEHEQDSHGAFGEYESHMSWYSYSQALEKYIEYLENLKTE